MVDEEEIEAVEQEEVVDEPVISGATAIVQAALEGNAVRVQSIFDTELKARLADAVEERKAVVAASLIDPDAELPPIVEPDAGEDVEQDEFEQIEGNADEATEIDSE